MAYPWPDNDVRMAFAFLFQALITMGLGALGALLGAILLWKYWALPKISSWITNEGSSKLRGWLAKILEHPDGPEAQEVGKLTGVAFAYALQGLEEMATTQEGRERLKPILAVIQEHISQSIFATWGHILEKLREKGEGMPGLPGLQDLPPEILGIAGKMFPGVDMKQALGLLSFAQRFTGGPGSGASGPGNGSHSLKGEL